MADADRIGPLLADLVSARDRLLATLDAIPPQRLTEPGVIGEWSPQELIAHVGYWAGHAVELIHAAELGRLDDFGVADPPIDEVNATVARVARESDLTTVRTRERAAFDVLAERLRRLDPALLDQRLPDGATVEKGVCEDAVDHYREHGEELARIVGGG
jgi:hypothetical protein